MKLLDFIVMVWATVPDAGTKVVVTFLEGRRNNGVIIGCLIDNQLTQGSLIC